MRILLTACVALFSFTGCGDGGHELERKYDRLKLDMTTVQVAAIMGQGKPVTTAEIAAYPEFPKLDLTGLPEDARWVRWGDGYPYVVACFSKDKLVLSRILGVGPPKRLGR